MGLKNEKFPIHCDFLFPKHATISRRNSTCSINSLGLHGDEMAELVNEEKTPGSYEVTFDSDKLLSGIYIYRIKTLGYQRYKKMILIK